MSSTTKQLPQISLSEAAEKFKAALQTAGLTPPDVIEPGKLHRFPTNGKRGDDAGWCKLFPDMRGGVFGDHRSGISDHWSIKADPAMTTVERKAFRRQVAESKRQAEAEERRRHEAAARKAAAILETATGDPATHPYALRHQEKIRSFGAMD
jgi:putative DNA primase/helicase